MGLIVELLVLLLVETFWLNLEVVANQRGVSIGRAAKLGGICNAPSWTVPQLGAGILI